MGLTAAEIATLPKLQIICVIGAGYEQVDLAAAAARGITVTNGAGANAAAVADHTMAMLLALLRDIPRADASTRRGEWNRVISPSVSGKRLGLLGLGAVGQAIAKRASLGFDMNISYHSRTPRMDVPYTWYDSPLHLADAVDILVVATPVAPLPAIWSMPRYSRRWAQRVSGQYRPGQRSRHPGPGLRPEQGRLAGAALDVFDDEPAVPDALKALGNTVLTPHVAGQSPEAARDTVTLVLRNLQAFFAGEPVLTPVRA